MNREQFAIVFKLSKTAPWLVEKSEALCSLLFDDCANDSSRDLLIELINRFHYISNERYHEELTLLATSLIAEEDVKPETTQLIAMAADESSDSSQLILYGLKSILHNLGWFGYGEVNRFGLAYQKFKQNNLYRNLVLVDEFIGSGQTVISRVREIKRVFDTQNVDDYRISVRVLVASSVGIEAIKSHGIDVHANHIIGKGISDYYPPDVVSSKMDIMLQLENILAPSIGESHLPSLGYGGCESLYLREYGNVPNCVFPFFWWPLLSDGRQRKLVMHRARL